MTTFLILNFESDTGAISSLPPPVQKAFQEYRERALAEVERYGGLSFEQSPGELLCRFTSDKALACALGLSRLWAQVAQEQQGFEDMRLRMALHTVVSAANQLESGQEIVRSLLRTMPRERLLLTPDVMVHCHLPADVILRDLGVHLLCDLNYPYKILALDPHRREASSAYGVKPDLSEPSELIGRTTEAAQIIQRLQKPDCRLLTLLGTGGVGKSRLAVHVARLASDSFPGGAYFVSVDRVESPEDLLQAVARSMGVCAAPDEENHLLSQLLAFLAKKRILLVMNNVDLLIDCTREIITQLSQPSRLAILATSRERLNLSGEWILEVNGLSYPPAGVSDPTIDVTAYAAVQLFIIRARQIYPDFALTEQEEEHIVRICQLVDGLPLAIELAASWIGTLSCRQIAYQLERNEEFLTRPSHALTERRQVAQTLFTRSWRSLSDEEQWAFTRLAIFRQGFTRDAAMFVTRIPLWQLVSLVDKSLIRTKLAPGARSLTRYEISPFLYRFLLPRAEQHGPEWTDLHENHAAYYSRLLFERTAALEGERQLETLAELRADLENIKAAWHWAVSKMDLLKINDSLEGFSILYELSSRLEKAAGLLQEPLHALSLIQPEDRDELETRVLGRLLLHQSRLYMVQNNPIAADRQAAEALSLLLPFADEPRIARELGLAFFIQSVTAWTLGNYEQARRLSSCSLEQYQAAGDTGGMARPLRSLGIIARRQGQYDQARQYYRRSLRISQQAGNLVESGRTKLSLGVIEKMEGNYAACRKLYEESLEIARLVGDAPTIFVALNNLGRLALEEQAYDSARDLFEKKLTIHRQLKDRGGEALALVNLAEVASALEQPAEARQYYLEGLQLSLETKVTPRALIALIGLARILAQEGAIERALDMLAFVLEHPAVIQDHKERAGRLWERLTRGFSKERTQMIRQRASGREADAVAREVVGYMTGSLAAG